MASCLGSIASPSEVVQDQERMFKAVKAFQRTSREARARWNDYCDVYGKGVRDPLRHPPAFLHHFFELRDQGCLPELEASIHERSLSSALSQEDYRAILEAKAQRAIRVRSLRQYFSRRFGAVKVKAVDSSGLLEFLRIVEEADTRNPYACPAQFQSPWGQCVKKMQSSRLTWKLQWDAHVESNGRGIRDPSRHPAEFLIKFLKQVLPPCPNPMLHEFGLSLKDMQFKEVNPHSGAVKPLTPSSDPKGMQFTEALLNMQCSSIGRSQATAPAEGHAQSKSMVPFGGGRKQRRQQRLQMHGTGNGRAASWPPMTSRSTDTNTSYAVGFHVRNTFLELNCVP